MTIKLLLIEDDPSFLELAANILTDLGPDISLQVAKSRNAALSILESDSFDLIILDLKLPTNDDTLDLEVEHGRFVFEATQRLAPGTPVLILTGSPAEAFIADFLQRSTQVDVWGDGKKTPTIRFLRKSDLDKLSGLLEPSIESLRAVRDIEVRPSGSRVNLTWEQDRLVRIFVRRRGGASCTVFRLSGGLSGAEVFRVSIADEQGVPILNSIIKIGPPEMVESEVAKYNRHAQRLQESATARLIEDVRYGGCRSAAVTYRLAETFTRNMFDIARAAPDRASAMVAAVAELLRPWRDGVPETRVNIRSIRRRVLSDEKARRVAEQFDLDWVHVLEKRNVQVRWCCIHGDLHGGNVLIDEAGVPILIDYGDIDEGPAALDWVTLELSLLFHPDGCARATIWPNNEACAGWADPAAFAGDGPFAAFIGACREASQDASAGPRELAAAAYAYLLLPRMHTCCVN